MQNTYTEQDIRSRLSISTYVFRGHRALSIKTLAELTEHGFRRVELWESPDQYEMTRMDSIEHVLRDCAETGVEICAYHASLTNLSEIDTPEDRAKSLDRCKRQIDTLRGAGAKIWGSHIREVTPEAEECLAELLAYVEGTDVVIVLENFARQRTSVADRVALMDKMAHPQLGLVLDIGHVRNGQGENPMTLPGGPSEVLDVCAAHLRFLHLHGFVETDHYPPLVDGDRIQWAELFQKLHDIGYGGFFNFEPRGAAFHENTLEMTERAPAVIAEMLHNGG
jgi:sugar phosphate isomerase/epimerase